MAFFHFYYVSYNNQIALHPNSHLCYTFSFGPQYYNLVLLMFLDFRTPNSVLHMLNCSLYFSSLRNLFTGLCVLYMLNSSFISVPPAMCLLGYVFYIYMLNCCLFSVPLDMCFLGYVFYIC